MGVCGRRRYTGGSVANPKYMQVGTGTTGHAEGVQVLYDTTVVSYEALLDAYWRSIDPTTPNRQVGPSADPKQALQFPGIHLSAALASGSASGAISRGVQIGKGSLDSL